MNRSSARRICTIVSLSLAAIFLHELGHYTVYRVADIPVQVTFQSVRPTTPVTGPVADLGLVAGPVFSLVGALACLLIARHRPGFFWTHSSIHECDPTIVPLHHGLASRPSRSDAIF